MRHSMWLGVAALALVAGMAGPRCAAQSIPTGTYQQTCRDIRVNGDTLQARCEDVSRHWQSTQLSDYWRCSGDISNINGRLTCDKSGNGQASGAPAGSYTQSCRDIRMRGNRLEARCRDGSGNWNATSLNYVDRCTSDIANVNGSLRCETSQNNDGAIPSGSYSQSCRDIRMRSGRLEARCEDANGNWNTTSLENPGRCGSDIVNDNGQLRCQRRGRQGRSYNWQGNAPQGSYTQSCQNIRVSGKSLEADCPNPGGHVKTSSIPDFTICTKDIANRNGKLSCER